LELPLGTIVPTVPSDKMELALKIEADRMRNSLLLKKDKEAEMTVPLGKSIPIAVSTKGTGTRKRYHYFDKELYDGRYAIEPTDAWMESFRSLSGPTPPWLVRKILTTSPSSYWPLENSKPKNSIQLNN